MLQRREDLADFYIAAKHNASALPSVGAKRLNNTMPQRRIESGDEERDSWCFWPPSLLYLPCDCFLWCYVKDAVFVPPLLAEIPRLEGVISEEFIKDVLAKVWEINWNVESTLSV